MENLLKELLRNYIKEQNFTESNYILKSLKEIFAIAKKKQYLQILIHNIQYKYKMLKIYIEYS